MEKEQLDELRKLLPTKYGKVISDKLIKKHPLITAEVVVKVFAGSTTNPDLVNPVLDEALKIAQETKKRLDKINEVLK